MRVNPLQAAGQAYVDAEEQYLVVASRHLQAKRRWGLMHDQVSVGVRPRGPWSGS